MEHAPLLLLIERELSKEEHNLKQASQFGGSHNYKTKQTTFLHG
jgi:hypothetical protein